LRSLPDQRLLLLPNLRTLLICVGILQLLSETLSLFVGEKHLLGPFLGPSLLLLRDAVPLLSGCSILASLIERLLFFGREKMRVVSVLTTSLSPSRIVRPKNKTAQANSKHNNKVSARYHWRFTHTIKTDKLKMSVFAANTSIAYEAMR